MIIRVWCRCWWRWRYGRIWNSHWEHISKIDLWFQIRIYFLIIFHLLWNYNVFALFFGSDEHDIYILLLLCVIYCNFSHIFCCLIFSFVNYRVIFNIFDFDFLRFHLKITITQDNTFLTVILKIIPRIPSQHLLFFIYTIIIRINSNIVILFFLIVVVHKWYIIFNIPV